MACVLTCRICSYPNILATATTLKVKDQLGQPWKISFTCPRCKTAYYGEIGITKASPLSQDQVEAIRTKPT